MNRRSLLTSLLTGLAAWNLPSLAKVRAEDENGLDAIVIGGGVSGLTAAWLLAKDDFNVTLLEGQNIVGGRAVSGRFGGWSYAKGTEYLGKPEGVFKAMIDELGLTPVEIPFPMDMAYRKGRFISGAGQKVEYLVNEGGLNAYNRFLKTLQEVGTGYSHVPDHDPKGPLARLDHITCRQWFEEMDLPPVYHRVYNVMARGLFGANIDEISALGAFEEIAFDFQGEEELEDMSDVWDAAAEISNSGSYAFLTGITEVTDGLAAALGKRVRTGARVTYVEGSDDEGYEVTYVDALGKEPTAQADAVVIATPAPVTLEIAGDALSREQRDILRQIPYAPYITVAFYSDEPIFDKAFDLALPDGWFLTDLYDSTWIQRHLDPRAAQFKGAVSSAYIGPTGYSQSEFLDLSDAEIVRRSLREMERVSPGAAKKVTGHDVQRYTYAYPVTTPGAFARLTRLHKTMTGGLQLAGDGVVYPTFQTAIAAGELAADRVDEFLQDSPED